MEWAHVQKHLSVYLSLNSVPQPALMASMYISIFLLPYSVPLSSFMSGTATFVCAPVTLSYTFLSFQEDIFLVPVALSYTFLFFQVLYSNIFRVPVALSCTLLFFQIRHSNICLCPSCLILYLSLKSGKAAFPPFFIQGLVYRVFIQIMYIQGGNARNLSKAFGFLLLTLHAVSSVSSSFFFHHSRAADNIYPFSSWRVAHGLQPIQHARDLPNIYKNVWIRLKTG